MTRRSTLSVVIANYNHASYIGGALEAALGQSRRPDEIVVVDDCSTDNSVEVIERYASNDPVVKLIRCERNQGPAYASNLAVQRSTADYLYFGSADDRVLPGFFETAIGYLEENSQAGLFCGTAARLTAQGEYLQDSRYQGRSGYLAPAEVVDLELRSRFLLSDCTPVIKRKALCEFGGIQPELRWIAYWFVEIAVGFKYGLCYWPDRPLVAIGYNPKSYSAKGRRDGKASRDVLRLAVDLLETPAFAGVVEQFRETGMLCCLPGSLLFLTDAKARRLLSFEGFKRLIRTETGSFIRAGIPNLSRAVDKYRDRYENRPVNVSIRWPSKSDKLPT